MHDFYFFVIRYIMKKNKTHRTRTSNDERRIDGFSNHLQFPQDVMCGVVIVTVTGRREIMIENFKGIIVYEDERIQIQTKDCKLTILGNHLKVDYYTNEEMKIVGRIHQICYEV